MKVLIVIFILTLISYREIFIVKFDEFPPIYKEPMLAFFNIAPPFIIILFKIFVSFMGTPIVIGFFFIRCGIKAKYTIIRILVHIEYFFLHILVKLFHINSLRNLVYKSKILKWILGRKLLNYLLMESFVEMFEKEFGHKARINEENRTDNPVGGNG